MTGRGAGWGYRYSIHGIEWDGALIGDCDLGAIDAPAVLPAGSHCSAWWLDGVAHVSAVRRMDRRHCAVNVGEWRV